jgi:hypothetical protein
MACTTLIAIDPGDEHVGYATFERRGPEALKPTPWICTGAFIRDDPPAFLRDFAESVLVGDFDIVVYERFGLFGTLAEEQIGSEFDTSQMIGVIRWIVDTNNLHVDMHEGAIRQGLLTTCEQQGGTCSDPERPFPERVVLHGQQPQVQGKNGPARGILRAHGIKSVAARMKALPHGQSAELHGWYFIGRYIEGWGE